MASGAWTSGTTRGSCSAPDERLTPSASRNAPTTSTANRSYHTMHAQYRRSLSAVVRTNEVTTGIAFAAASSGVASRTPCAKQNMATSGAKFTPGRSASGMRSMTAGSKVLPRSRSSGEVLLLRPPAASVSLSLTPTSE